MKITNSNTLSFKARLLTTPENFIRETDSNEDKKYIKDVFALTNIMLNTKQVSKYTNGDTIEFKRHNSKKKFVYNISYKTQDIKETDPNKKVCENIIMEGKDLKSVFNISDIFRTITQVVAYKRGVFAKTTAFTPYEQIRDMAFEYTKEQSEKLSSLNL